jgi:hypothetical protein
MTLHPTTQRIAKRSSASAGPKGYNMDFNQWGPCYWRTLHAVTFNYPGQPSAEDIQRMREFFALIPFMIPCPACGLHFARALRETHPMTSQVLASQESLTRWLVDVHNAVNRRLEKPEVHYDDVRQFYLMDATHELLPGSKPAMSSDTIVAISLGTTLALVLMIALVSILLRRRVQRLNEH